MPSARRAMKRLPAGFTARRVAVSKASQRSVSDAAKFVEWYRSLSREEIAAYVQECGWFGLPDAPPN